jgi:hypothetical protein
MFIRNRKIKILRCEIYFSAMEDVIQMNHHESESASLPLLHVDHSYLPLQSGSFLFAFTEKNRCLEEDLMVKDTN